MGGAIYNFGSSKFAYFIESQGYAFDDFAQDFGYSDANELLADFGYTSPEQFTAIDYLFVSQGVHDLDEFLDAIGITYDELMTEFEDAGYSSLEDVSWDELGLAPAKLTFTGESTFTNNRANNELNDIYNDGIINLAAGAKVTPNSGINGENGTLNLASGSTLNVNHYLEGQTLNLDDATVNLGAFNQTTLSPALSQGEEGVVTYGTLDLTACLCTQFRSSKPRRQPELHRRC